VVRTGKGGPGRGCARRGGGRAKPRGRAAGLGRVGEEAAARYLVEVGYRVIERNYRCRAGEIDLIALDGEVLCFIEVKARRTGAYGGGLEAVEGRKRARLRRAASWYLGRFGDRLPPCRCDVAEVWLDPEGRPERVTLVRNAF